VGNTQDPSCKRGHGVNYERPTEYEPFLGSGGVLGVLAPERAVASDAFGPLVQIWQTLHSDIEGLKRQYAECHALIERMGKKEAYEHVLARYNNSPNGAERILTLPCRKDPFG